MDDLQDPRPARPDERDDLLATINYIFRTSQGRPASIAADYPHVYAPTNLENVIVVTAGDKIVSSAGVWPCDIRVGQASLRVGGVNAVGTLPACRTKGLGTRVMAAAHQQMRNLGCHVGLLSTGIYNWYRGMGWERAGVQRTYRLDRSTIALLPTLPANCAAEPLVPDDTADILAIHHADELGALRTPELFDQLVQAKKIAAGIVARRDGRVAAYLLIKERMVVEWGGAADLVAGLVHAWFARLDDPGARTSDRNADLVTDIALQTFGAATPLQDLLDARRIPCALDYAGMLLVVDPAGVLEAFGRTDIAITQSGEAFHLQCGEQTGTFTRCELAKLFFGPERLALFAQHLLPLPFWQWPLERV